MVCRRLNRLSAQAEGRFFDAPEGSGGGCCVHRGPLKMHPVPQEGVFVHRALLKMRRVPQEAVLRTRISVRYQRRRFPVPNITPVPEKPVFLHRKCVAYPRSLFCAPNASENPFGTPGACSAHRTHIPYHRRPSPVPNATNTTQSHPAAQTTASSTPSLQPSASWKPPGTRNNRFAEKPLRLFQKVAGTFTQFFYICAE